MEARRSRMRSKSLRGCLLQRSGSGRCGLSRDRPSLKFIESGLPGTVEVGLSLESFGQDLSDFSLSKGDAELKVGARHLAHAPWDCIFHHSASAFLVS